MSELITEMSGADLDGDEFWIITQKDLLPRPQAEINAIVPKQGFDDQGERRLSEYIDDFTIVDYFLEYSLLENTSELASIHEAYTEHSEEGMGHKDCLLIAKHHSFALDFAKTGVIIPIPKEANIPNNEEIRKWNHCIFPHFAKNKPHSQRFKSKMIKGRLWDFVLSQVPRKFINDSKFRIDACLPKFNDPQLSDRPILRGPHMNSNEEQKCDNNEQYRREQSMQQSQGYSSESVNYQNQRHENVDDYSSCEWGNGAQYDIQNDMNSDSDQSGSDDPQMRWVKDVNFETLIGMISYRRVRQYLYDGEFLSMDEIYDFRRKLQELRETLVDEKEQWQAFHVDYYYECILQRNKELSQQPMPSNERYEYSDSDDVNENEEEKKEVVK